MFYKRFRSNTVRDGLALVRAELGADAVVLSSELVTATGWRGLMGAREVEITAALDREVSEARPARTAGRPRRGAESIVAHLCAAGFERGVAEQVAAHARRGTRNARGAVTAWAAGFCASDDSFAGIEVFVGPPGAGKTTTIAKVAAQERARRGAKLGLVAADAFRVGAIEQLRLYADIIGAPFQAVRTPAELSRALADRTMSVLVDTAGRSPRDERAREFFAVLSATPGVRTHLVIPAGSTVRDVDRVIAAHAEACPHRIVLSKVDEAESAVALAGAIRDRGLRVSYLGTGQRVPEDLIRATPANLAAALLGEAGQPAGGVA